MAKRKYSAAQKHFDRAVEYFDKKDWTGDGGFIKGRISLPKGNGLWGKERI